MKRFVAHAVCAVGAAACAPTDRPSDTPYLAAAVEAARWLQSNEHTVTAGIPDEAGAEPVATADLGTGAAGRSLFFLELHYATSDDRYLAAARREMTVAVRRVSDSSAGAPRYGLYNGASGVAVAAAELYRATSDLRYREHALDIVAVLRAAANDGEEGVTWGRVNDVLAGTAGIGLALLHVGRTLNDSAAIDLARRAGHALLRRAAQHGDGLWWSRSAEGELNLPNFSHGTAGVGYFLAVLFEATGDAVFLEASERGARYLMGVAERRDGLFLVPYGIPNDGYVTAYDIGWAHGPPGTALLFAILADLTGQASYRALVAANVRTLEASGIPNATADPDRWAGPFRIDRRFGTSGAAVFLLRHARINRDTTHVPLARAIVADILERGNRGANGISWSLRRYGFQGGEGTAAYTGFFYGAAGLGLTLLEMHYTEIGSAASVRWPDDPYAGWTGSR